MTKEQQFHNLIFKEVMVILKEFVQNIVFGLETFSSTDSTIRGIVL